MTGDEMTCPACEECGWFTICDDGACPSVRCQNCGHRIGVLVLAAAGIPLDTGAIGPLQSPEVVRYMIKHAEYPPVDAKP